MRLVIGQHKEVIVASDIFTPAVKGATRRVDSVLCMVKRCAVQDKVEPAQEAMHGLTATARTGRNVAETSASCYFASPCQCSQATCSEATRVEFGVVRSRGFMK